jgi:hypothetical protein
MKGQKKGVTDKVTPYIIFKLYHYFLGLGSEETLSFFLPFALLLDKILLPALVAIRSLKPCLFLLFLFEG